MNITNKILAGYPGLYIVTHEEARAEMILDSTCREIGYGLHVWTVVDGRYIPEDMDEAGNVIRDAKAFKDENDPLLLLDSIMSNKVPQKTVILLKDFHMLLASPDPEVFRKLKDALIYAKQVNKCIVILAPILKLPLELEKLFSVIEITLPTREQLKVTLGAVCESGKKLMPTGSTLVAALDAASGLTTFEAEDAFALSLVESKGIDPKIISREKASTIKKNGILELVDSTISLDDIGGLDVLKGWMLERSDAYSKDAMAYGLPVPKGILVIGIQGTGKSLIAKATASALGDIPLLKLDAGRIFGGIVGQSEENLRTVFQTAEAIAPCVLWIDEFEKGFGKGGGENDGKTSERVYGSLLTWMNDKTAPVFIVATANDPRRLDPAVVRRGRFDEVMFVDLPHAGEREDIWKVQIKKWKRDPEDFDLPALAKLTENYVGAEIEALFRDALFRAYKDGKREPTELDISRCTEEFIPLYTMMGADIDSLRKWKEGRARSASTPPPSVTSTKIGTARRLINASVPSEV